MNAHNNLSVIYFFTTGSREDLVGDCGLPTIYSIEEPGPDGKKTSSYEYKCFEEDPLWGIASFAFMCVPGVFFWIFISYR